MTATVQRLHPEEQPTAIGYVRVSRKLQAQGHSPDVQRQAIMRLCEQQGYELLGIEEDAERGGNPNRAGYQRVINKVQSGVAHRVVVFQYDRWGRDGVEWLSRAQEFDRLGVDIVSVQEGVSQKGPIRFFHAGMAQYYSEQLAQKVLPAREAAARQGIHMGATPIGYRREYPPYKATERKPAGKLVPDPKLAPVVAEFFRRYASGGWSTKSLAEWANTDPAVPPPPEGGVWMFATIARILHNPVYVGKVRYNQNPEGRYEQAPPGSMFVVDGQHEALVDQATFDEVQRRVQAAIPNPSYNRTHTKSGIPVALAKDIMHCACGSKMYRRVGAGGTQQQYICLARHERGTCNEPSYRADVAHAALLAEIKRLHYRQVPLVRVEEALLGPDGSKEAKAIKALETQLKQAQAKLDRHTRRFSEQVEEPTEEEIASHRRVGKEISAEIARLKSQLEEAKARQPHAAECLATYARIVTMDPGNALEALLVAGEHDQARELLLALVDYAVVIARKPLVNTRWVRLAIRWKPDIQALLDAGFFWLDSRDDTPAFPCRKEQSRLAQQRYRAKKRSGQESAQIASLQPAL
jgi:site-specific DNA recombinase